MSLKIGDILPQFSLKNQVGDLFSIRDDIGKKVVVIFFYPKNFTLGCIKEVCSFRDSFEDFLSIGATVIGISADSQASHRRFGKHYNLPYTLLADTDKKVRKLFGVENTLFGILPGRETFVFNASGILTYKFKSFNAQPHIDKALEHLQRDQLIEKQELYPLKFYPILKEKVWGGAKLSKLYKKGDGKNIGESWELSGVAENVSKVANGPLDETSLTTLIEEYKGELVGEKVYKAFGNKFPLLFKFIDADQDLSVQLHPDDVLAKERHDSFGKTEMWYIMQAEKEARIILGFNEKMDKASYLENLSENKLTETLHSEAVKAGDSFFIAPGTVHAIGAGVVLAEIQQTSDITYRIYDWGRPGIDGKMRDLHTEEAMAAINFEEPNAKLEYVKTQNEVVELCKSPFFETNNLNLTKDLMRDLSTIDSFVVYMCVVGEAIIETENASEAIKTGETLLIPAATSKLLIKTTAATILEIYVP